MDVALKLTAKILQCMAEDFCVGDRHDPAARLAGFGTDRSEEVGPFVLGLSWCCWSGSALGPDSGIGSLLAEARFILKPELDALTWVLASRRLKDRGKFF